MGSGWEGRHPSVAAGLPYCAAEFMRLQPSSSSSGGTSMSSAGGGCGAGEMGGPPRGGDLDASLGGLDAFGENGEFHTVVKFS